jgi:hypothetical protein
MKFILVVLLVRFMIAWITDRNKSKKKTGGVKKNKIMHPAEFELR